jgi:hypothetical protein
MQTFIKKCGESLTISELHDYGYSAERAARKIEDLLVKKVIRKEFTFRTKKYGNVISYAVINDFGMADL